MVGVFHPAGEHRRRCSRGRNWRDWEALKTAEGTDGRLFIGLGMSWGGLNPFEPCGPLHPSTGHPAGFDLADRGFYRSPAVIDRQAPKSSQMESSSIFREHPVILGSNHVKNHLPSGCISHIPFPCRIAEEGADFCCPVDQRGAAGICAPPERGRGYHWPRHPGRRLVSENTRPFLPKWTEPTEK